MHDEICSTDRSIARHYCVISLTPLSLWTRRQLAHQQHGKLSHLKLNMPPSCISSTTCSASATFILPKTLLTSSKDSV